ncbi:MAG TPA: aldolase/citrate lyase family protein [Pseudothermotoga sp.]|nr:aldolase/citrate lyase family protein [Pseudothermotoga sp.]HOK83473.1 aldolase/citrate lyase family protein [Pseudothermotoga sp.]HPP69546.1 aldolase/citrate lyase family protein [Pseudothermotoga sp.]
MVKLRENRTKRLLKQGKTVIGTMVSEIRTPGIAQMLSIAGFDFFVIDMEHSPFTLETVQDMVWAARASEITSIVRVPTRFGHHNLSRPLDCGAEGLLIPQVQEKEIVRQVIEATKYHPLGNRGIAIARTPTGFKSVKADDFIKWANDNTLIILQIESKKAIDNLEELIMPGVDACLVGPNDLSQSLGVPGDTNHPLVQEYIDKFVQKCLKLNLPCGIHLSSPDAIKPWLEKGMRLLMCSSDINLIVQGGKRIVELLRQD